MKCAAFYTVALACCLGLVLADFNDIYGSVMGLGYGAGYGSHVGYGGYGQATYVPVPAYGGAQRGAGNGSFLGCELFLRNVIKIIKHGKFSFSFIIKFIYFEMLYTNLIFAKKT